MKALVFFILFLMAADVSAKECVDLGKTVGEILTISSYDKRYESYISGTHHLDISPAIHPFIGRLPKNGRILEIGSGSGRDALQFKSLGFNMLCIDPSERLAESASKVIGEPVLVMRAQEMEFENEFDGVWAMASLIHIPEQHEEEVLRKIGKALKGGGIFFASYLYGANRLPDHEGRIYRGHDEESMRALLKNFPEFDIVEIKKTVNIASDGKSYSWLNVLLKKHQDD